MTRVRTRWSRRGLNRTNVESIQVAGAERISFTVHVIRARNLAKMDLRGKSDPYVVLRCGDAEHKTEVVKKSLAPEWQDARFQFDDVQSSGGMTAEMFDWDRGATDDPMGQVSIPLLGLESKTAWYDLQPMAGCKKAQGELQLACTVLPAAAAAPESTFAAATDMSCAMAEPA